VKNLASPAMTRAEEVEVGKVGTMELTKPCKQYKGWPGLRSQASRGSRPKCSQTSSAGL
jgi:hypothetical protein